MWAKALQIEHYQRRAEGKKREKAPPGTRSEKCFFPVLPLCSKSPMALTF
jgi:hypothetical protein